MIGVAGSLRRVEVITFIGILILYVKMVKKYFHKLIVK